MSETQRPAEKPKRGRYHFQLCCILLSATFAPDALGHPNDPRESPSEEREESALKYPGFWLPLAKASTLAGDMVSSGTITIAPDAGMNIDGNLTSSSDSLLVMSIAGPDEYSRVRVVKKNTLGGTLRVQLVNYDPQVGDRYELLSSLGGLAGRFDTVDLPPLPSGRRWALIQDDIKNCFDLDCDCVHDVTLVVVGPACGEGSGSRGRHMNLRQRIRYRCRSHGCRRRFRILPDAPPAPPPTWTVVNKLNHPPLPVFTIDVRILNLTPPAGQQRIENGLAQRLLSLTPEEPVAVLHDLKSTELEAAVK